MPLVEKPTQQVKRYSTFRREAPALLLILALGAILSVKSPAFLTSGNLLALSREISVIGIMACGETFALVLGGIDLSVASMLVLAAGGAAMALMAGWPLAVCILLGMLLGSGAGLINGALISAMSLPPIIVTLATYGVYRAILTLLTNSQEIGPLPASFAAIGLGTSPLLLLILVTGVCALAMGRTPFGRWLYAAGGNEEASRVSGLPLSMLKPTAYAISGLCAALAGFIVAGSSGGLQSKAAFGYELDVIAACVIGGVSLQGGRGSVIGAVAGAAFLRMVNNALILFNVPVDWYRMAIAVALLLAAIGDRFAQYRTERKR